MDPKNYNKKDLDTNLPQSLENNHHHDNKNKKNNLKVKTIIAILALSIVGGALGSYTYNGFFAKKNIFSNDSINPTLISDQEIILPTDTVVDLVQNSVVSITSIFSENGKTVHGTGSGVIYSQDGKIITNSHVIGNSENIKVTLLNGKEYSATLLGRDGEKDLAMLKINASNLTAATFAHYNTIKVGESVLVIGNPLGELAGTVTDGIVSAVKRRLKIEGKVMELLQTSAEINEGNSGGAVFDRQGHLIAIVIAKSSESTHEGLGFAIPINVVEEFANKF